MSLFGVILSNYVLYWAVNLRSLHVFQGTFAVQSYKKFFDWQNFSLQLPSEQGANRCRTFLVYHVEKWRLKIKSETVAPLFIFYSKFVILNSDYWTVNLTAAPLRR